MKKIFNRILMGFIGIMFLVCGVSFMLLGCIGETAVGEVTVVRREFGERNESIPNRYNYYIGYEFQVNDKTFHGNTRRIGDAFSAGISKGPHTVRYFKIAPFISSLEENAGISAGNLIILSAGILIFWLALVKRS